MPQGKGSISAGVLLGWVGHWRVQLPLPLSANRSKGKTCSYEIEEQGEVLWDKVDHWHVPLPLPARQDSMV